VKSFIIILMAGMFVGCAIPQVQTPTASQDITANGTPTQGKVKSKGDCSNTTTSFKCVKVVEVYDGDTIFVDLPDQHPLFGKRIGVRIFGIDTPEVRTKDACEKAMGYKAKKVLQQLLASADRVDLIDVKKDKFFRILAKVHVDGKPVANKLIQRGLAYKYFGTKKLKRNWCK